MNSLIIFTVAFIFVLAALLILFFWTVRLRVFHDSLILTVSREGLGEQSEKVKEILFKMKATQKEVTNTLLLIEEIVMRMHDHSHQAVTVHIRRWLFALSIQISAWCNFNPIAELPKSEGEDEDSIRNLIFQAHKAELSWKQRGKKSIVVLKVRSR